MKCKQQDDEKLSHILKPSTLWLPCDHLQLRLRFRNAQFLSAKKGEHRLSCILRIEAIRRDVSCCDLEFSVCYLTVLSCKVSNVNYCVRRS